MGKYQIVYEMYMLGFYYQPRATFFKKELSNLQALVKEEHLDIEKLKGFYVGAMGYVQFITSSYRHYAADFDNYGQRDLFNNPVDDIVSVANYFHSHGWVTDVPVAIYLANSNLLSSPLKTWAGECLHYQASDVSEPSLVIEL